MDLRTLLFLAEYRSLRWVPCNEYEVLDSEIEVAKNPVPALQDAYRRHGWPDLQQYRKGK
ncbi:hypothetical protein C8034_v008427 [Colletotrichum sidae]|uniref:Uncharacterized protein n=1 Tax=Colletotrichum sidae TaxID=1347389 RepID=A0A4R8TMG7_9PEZI|nr:hypothetical protein C8034_v008427 [Colletotrichum sidae]